MDFRYELKLKSQEIGKVYSFESGDGIKSKNSFREEELLLADHVPVKESDIVLIVQSGFGFLGTVLGDKSEEVTMYDTSARACRFSRTNAEQNDIEGYEVENRASVEEVEGKFDKVVYAPAGYTAVDLVKKKLTGSVELLKTDGELFISGRKKSGIKRYRKHLEKHGELTRIGKRDSIKAYCFKPSETPEAVDTGKQFSTEVDGIQADFETAEGLFSSGKLDDGTRLLLENLDVSGADKLLDAACGYGAISVFLGRKQSPQLFPTDDDARATSYARKNLERNGVENFTVETGDCLDAYQDQKFDAVISNPPTHQGEGVTRKLFRQTYHYLNKGGGFWLVYNQNMKYERKLADQFDAVNEVAQGGNFKVVRAEK